MFEKLFGKFKKPDPSKEEIVKPQKRELTDEEREIEEERKQQEIINQKVDDLDPETVARIEKKIRKEFDSELESDPEDLDEYFSELEEIKDDLWLEAIQSNQDAVMSTLTHQLIQKVFEEKLVSIGSSLEAFNEWEKMEDELEDELAEEEPSENVNGSYKR